MKPLITRDKKIVEIGRFFGEKSDFGGPEKDFAVEKSEKKNRRKIADFSWKFFFFDFFPDFKNMQKIASDGFRTHQKCLEMAPSNHQAIDDTYYI